MAFFAAQLALAALLLGGGAYLLAGAIAKLAPFLRIPTAAASLLTLYAASSPLLFISANAAGTGSPDIALGAMIGAVVAGSLLVPGLFALRSPIGMPRQSWRESGGLKICAAALVILLAQDNEISSIDGMLLLSLFAALNLFYLAAPAHIPAFETLPSLPPRICHNNWCAAAYVFIAGALLMIGANMAAGAALTLSRLFGMAETGAAMIVPGTLTALLWFIFPMVRNGARLISFMFFSSVFALLGMLGLSATANPLPVMGEGVQCGLLALPGAIILLLLLLRLRGLRWPHAVLLLALFAAWVVYQFRLTLHLYA